MQMKDASWFLERAGAAPAIRKMLEAQSRPDGIAGEISEAAQPFVAALLLRRMAGRAWVVCPDVRRQEDFARELAAWCPRVKLFPGLELPAGDALPDPETASERLEVLGLLARPKGDEVVVLHEAQWDSPVPSPSSLSRGTLRLGLGRSIPIEEVAAGLLKAGYEQAPQVVARGQFARRGGILDVFSWQAPRPVRIEWFDLEIDSLREFDIDTQGSISTVGEVEILIARTAREEAVLRDYRARGDLLILVDPEGEPGGLFLGSGIPADAVPAGTVPFFPQPFAETRDVILVDDGPERPVIHLFRDVELDRVRSNVDDGSQSVHYAIPTVFFIAWM